MKTQVLNLDDRLLKKREVAEKLACSLRTVDRLADSGRLTRVKWLVCAFVQMKFRQLSTAVDYD